MGLDMYAWSVAQEDVIDDFTIAKKEDAFLGSEIFYWRKHHGLHKWMETLYRERGGVKESFNCVPIRLYSEDLDRLQETADELLQDEFTDEFQLERDQEFIAKARSEIADGRAVYYDSWW
jgi:hypothetical protein